MDTNLINLFSESNSSGVVDEQDFLGKIMVELKRRICRTRNSQYEVRVRTRVTNPGSCRWPSLILVKSSREKKQAQATSMHTLFCMPGDYHQLRIEFCTGRHGSDNYKNLDLFGPGNQSIAMSVPSHPENEPNIEHLVEALVGDFYDPNSRHLR